MMEIFEGRKPSTPAYLKYQISTETLERIRAASTKAEASSAFDLFVRSQLGRDTFQFPEDIAGGIRLFSTIELWNEVALKLGATASTKNEASKNIKMQLSIIVQRRNSIAHEGDLQRSPLREPWPIKLSDMTVVSEFIEKIVRAIDAIV
jgi:hypothetical protein